MQSSRGKELHRTPPLPSMEEIKYQPHHPRKKAVYLMSSAATSCTGCKQVLQGSGSPQTVCTAPSLSPPVFPSPIQCLLHAVLQADCSFSPSFLPLHPYTVGSEGGGCTQPGSIRSAPTSPSPGHQVNTFLPTKFKPSQLQLTCVLYLKPLICSPNEHKKKLRYSRLRSRRAYSLYFPLPSSLPIPKKTFCPLHKGGTTPCSHSFFQTHWKERGINK